MEKLLNLLNNNPDKTMHFLSGYLVSTLFHCPIHGLIAGFAVGVAKECYDYKHPKHTCDIKDAIATTIGATMAYLVMTWR